MYLAATPVPNFAEYTPIANSVSPAAYMGNKRAFFLKVQSQCFCPPPKKKCLQIIFFLNPKIARLCLRL